MSVARVVTFEGVSTARMEEMRSQIEGSERPEGVPATEFVVLHDPATERALVVFFFDSEADYAAGDAALNAMPAGETPGRRTSVSRYDVAVRMTASAAG